MLEDEREHSVTLVVEAPADLPSYDAQFEPEGGIVTMEPGDRITITMAGPTPPEIMVHPYPGGLSIWRDLNARDIRVTDKDGNLVEDLY